VGERGKGGKERMEEEEREEGKERGGEEDSGTPCAWGEAVRRSRVQAPLLDRRGGGW